MTFAPGMESKEQLRVLLREAEADNARLRGEIAAQRARSLRLIAALEIIATTSTDDASVRVADDALAAG
jgi:hypothetical protein